MEKKPNQIQPANGLISPDASLDYLQITQKKGIIPTGLRTAAQGLINLIKLICR